jgi:cephalosporin hydroxylase
MKSLRRVAIELLPTPIREGLRDIRDDRRSVGEHLDVYGPAQVIDLTYVEPLRAAPLKTLTDAEALAALLPTLGLNDERVSEFPAELHGYAGKGLLHWQYPTQFAPYLIELSRRNVRSYVEIGTRHGGTFVITVEYLRRFQNIEWALGIDIQPAKGLDAYAAADPVVDTAVMSSRGQRFRWTLKRHAPIDLVLIDGDHSADAVRADFETVREHARLIAFHDIVNQLVPGVGAVWREVVERYADDWEFLEFTAQYPEVVGHLGHPLLGIGLAMRRG